MTSAANVSISAFFVSDQTGITAQTMGSALLAQFPDAHVVRRTFPFVNSPERAQRVLAEARASDRVTVMLTTVRIPEVATALNTGECLVMDLLSAHLRTLEAALGLRRSEAPERHHGAGDADHYRSRIQAIEYTMEHDDAQSVRMLNLADLFLIAPSRCGKTPTAMYMALQHRLRVANYPLTEDDGPDLELPMAIAPYAAKCFGLTSTPQRLSQLREERRPGSEYASLAQCRRELRWAESLYRRHGIPSVSSAGTSVEEIAATILQAMNLRGVSIPSPAMRRR
ncbi:pyruvate, water dikinase regulatory protein [Nesterenkonia sp. NBAIMH1]|uniref:pyruvate, water dikinase regulatory protein n=1 Tax=Nesterenkonia sp. NBAIMH1 TaxID=2600320 RepID=UPI0011B54607|nr:pyruvate, phosphate dikinase/phosphoenolpyruvate synthase regulator [Nesterenkonia sp. NBAIMH1]